MTVVAVKNKRAQLLFRIGPFARRRIKVVRGIIGKLLTKLKLLGTIRSPQAVIGKLTIKDSLVGKISLKSD